MITRTGGLGRVIQAQGARRGVITRVGRMVELAGGVMVSAPFNTTLPVISGVVKGGALLTCSEGSWDNAPASFDYQWYEDGVPILGASSSTMVVAPSMIPALITCQVTATNDGGSSAASALAVSSSLRPLFVLDPDVRLWSHEQGISTPVGDPVAAWLSVDGVHTLIQGQTTRQPLRRAGDLYLDGLDDALYGDAQAALFNAAYSVLVGVSDLPTSNDVRALFSSATNAVSTGSRRISLVNLSLGTAPSLGRMRYLLGGNSSAAQVDLTGLYALGASHLYNLAFRTVSPGTGDAEALRLIDPVTSLDTKSWPSVGMANDLFAFGAQRLNSSFAPSNHFQGSVRYLAIFSRRLLDAELVTARAALVAEGLT